MVSWFKVEDGDGLDKRSRVGWMAWCLPRPTEPNTKDIQFFTRQNMNEKKACICTRIAFASTPKQYQITCKKMSHCNSVERERMKNRVDKKKKREKDINHYETNNIGVTAGSFISTFTRLEAMMVRRHRLVPCLSSNREGGSKDLRRSTSTLQGKSTCHPNRRASSLQRSVPAVPYVRHHSECRSSRL